MSEIKKVLVLGDSCSDLFTYGICSRLCPEAPVPVFNPTRTFGNGGMAINLMENLKALGVQTDIITNDYRPVKTRFVDEVSNQMLLRIDDKDHIAPVTRKELTRLPFSDYEAIVIADYNKGFLSAEDIEFISKEHDTVFLDTKKKLGPWCNRVGLIKINHHEYTENIDHLTYSYTGTLIVTKGRDGAVLNKTKHFPIEEEHNIMDLSGAGDTFLAALVYFFLKTKDIDRSIQFANRCAAWVVTQRGVAVIDPSKVSEP